MYYVYILLLKGSKLYTGYTEDIKRRLSEHLAGKVKSTKHLCPIKLIHYEGYLLEEDARRREKFLKTSDGKLFLNRQLSAFMKKIRRYKNIDIVD